MDDSTKATEPNFRSPPRVLIPKLVQSRDNWKAKANQRNRDLKNAQVRSRDLAISRERWKQRAQDADQQIHTLQEQLQQTQRLLEQTRAEAADLLLQEQKNSSRPS